MTASRGMQVPAEGLTLSQFWRTHVHLVDPLTGQVVCPTPTTKQRALIAAIDAGALEVFLHQQKKTAKSFNLGTIGAWHTFADPHHRGNA